MCVSNANFQIQVSKLQLKSKVICQNIGNKMVRIGQNTFWHILCKIDMASWSRLIPLLLVWKLLCGRNAYMVTSALVLSPSGPWTGCKMMSNGLWLIKVLLLLRLPGQWQRTTPAKCKNLNALHGTLQVASFIVCHRQTRTSSCKARQGQAPRPRALLFQTWLAVLAVPDPVPWEKKCQESRSTATRPWSTAGFPTLRQHL